MTGSKTTGTEAPGAAPGAEAAEPLTGSIRPLYFEPSSLASIAGERATAFRAAQPFPHVVIDDFLPEWVVEGLLDEFPSPDARQWNRYDGATEVKLELTRNVAVGPFTRAVLAQFASAEVVDFLQHLTGIAGLVPDPHLVGGGLHQIERGGYLAVHADFNQHPELRLDRRLNVLVYLNRQWREEYGGHLELWDRRMQHADVRVLPVANRCVVFATSSFSYHGHPDPLTCPEGWTRKSIAFYYYSNGRPPGEISATAHSTLFRARPANRSERARVLAQRFAPPVLTDAYRSFANRAGGRRSS